MTHDELAEMFAGIAGDLGGEFQTVMDFGCGAGRLVEAFENRGATAYGCDVAAYLASA